MLQQLSSGRTFLRIAHEATLEEIDALGTELVDGWELWRVALRDVVHDGPLVVERGPGAATGRHLEDDATEGPDVDGAIAPRVLAFDHLRGHVHRGAGHGFIGFAGFGGHEGFALAGDDFGCAEIYVLDDTVMVEENV